MTISSAADPPLPPSQPLPSPPRTVLPRHIAVIVDGNRRWARRHHTHPAAAYRRGGERVHELLTWCQVAGIRAVTLWPLSADNLRRDPDDVRALAQVITEVVCELADAGCWRLHLFDNPALLGDDARRRVCGAVRRTGRVSGMAVNIAVAYDGREDITAAVRSLLAEHAGRGPRSRTSSTALPVIKLRAKLSEHDLDVYAAEFERTGLTGALNRYRTMDRDWEDLAPHRGAPIKQPSLFIGGTLDASTTWMADAIDAYPTTLPGLSASHLLEGCGHWIQQERPEEINRLLTDWLTTLQS